MIYMEHRFINSHAFTPDLFDRFAAAFDGRKKLSMRFWIFALVFLVMAVVFCALWIFTDTIFWVFLCLAMYAVYAILACIYPRRLSKTTFGALNPRLRYTNIELTFDDDFFYVRTALTAESLSYASIMDAAETDDIFLLFLSKNSALSLPKETFSLGRADEFSQFITQKCGIAVPYSKKRKKLIIPAILAVIAVFILLIGATIAKKYIPRTYSDPYGFSITLPSTFTQYNEYDFYAHDGTAYVENYYYDMSGYDGIDSPKDFIALLVSDKQEGSDIKVMSYPHVRDDLACVAYTYEYGGKEYYAWDIVCDNGDGFYSLTSFWVDYYYLDLYKTEFVKWAESIRVTVQNG